MPVLEAARKKGARIYVVGGILRDVFLARSRPNPDIDFAMLKGAVTLARNISRVFKAGFVALDMEHGTGRALKKEKDRVVTLDFSDLRAPDIEGDLCLRDFTINSMALPLQQLLEPGDPLRHIIDPLCGRKDILRRIIRMDGEASLKDDPLRLARAFSLRAMLGFRIEPATLKAIKRNKKLIRQVSGERVREELFKIFSSGSCYETIKEADKTGLLEEIFPEITPMRTLRQGSYHHLDVWSHSLETLKHFELIIKSKLNPQIRAYLAQEISSGHTRKDVLMFVALFHDIGKPPTFRIKNKNKVTFHGHERVGARMLEVVGQRLKLSNEEMRLISKIVRNHLRPGFLSDTALLTERAKFRFFRDSSPEPLGVLLVSLADQRATKGKMATPRSRLRHERLVRLLTKEFFHKHAKPAPVRLVNGHDLMKKFNLPPSELIGRLLAEIEELQAIGRINTGEDALKAAAKILKRIASQKAAKR